MRISDWSSDVCSSDLDPPTVGAKRHHLRSMQGHRYRQQQIVGAGVAAVGAATSMRIQKAGSPHPGQGCRPGKATQGALSQSARHTHTDTYAPANGAARTTERSDGKK